ncbi:polysaccharide pyruvyl transferase family protein [Oceanobacillus kimchii]|uniref:Polysaccharide pyruvyl transferase domain-containing protein n=1 Tax=Oceanobacillus kimchii TaxID=746691 RepID=A0ABQ5TPM9_9BACI|nr:polysaccharide pyruvyl transferase family protein [Oceanobacillus kimchii]GLO67573.1 hypothetical protein MACH08_33570 [Oceanobacillus kimchii]
MIALHGAYENENFGDELLIAIQSNWVKEIGLEICLPFASRVYREQIDSSSLVGVDALKKSSHLIYTGGGYFGEPNHNQVKWGINFFRKKHHIPGKIFKKQNKKYIVSGVGAGPITNFLTRASVRNICNSAEKVIVRDDQSYNYLKKYGVESSKLCTAADIVLTLKDDDISDEVMNNIKDKIQRKPGKFYFGVHIGVSPDDTNYSDNVKILIDSLANILKNRDDIIPVLIADKRQAISTQEKAIDYMRNVLGMDCIIYRHENIWSTCALLSSLDAVITTKLHVGITAYSLGTKTFGVAAHQKTKRFYSQINKNEYFYELKDVNDNIQSKIEDFLIDKYWDKETLDIRGELYQKSLVCKNEILRFIES